MDVTTKTDGWLQKQGEKGLVKAWKKRWFVLKGPRLYYYISAAEQKEKGFIDLDAASAIARKPDSQREFQIVTPNRVYSLMAPSPEELDEWVATLRAHTKSNRSPCGELSPRMTELQTLRERVSMLTQQLEQRDVQLVATNSQQQQSVRFLRELRQQLVDSAADGKFKQERIDRMQTALEQYQQKLSQAEASVNSLRAELALLRIEAEASHKDMVQADNKALNQLREELHKRDAALETARKRIAELETSQREALVERTRDDLHSALAGVPRPPGAEAQRCLALYDYVPRNSNELAVRKHDVITLHDASPSGWWKGEIEGRVGLFPGSYGLILEEGGDVLIKKLAIRRTTRIDSLVREAGLDKLERAATPNQTSPLIVRRSKDSQRKLSAAQSAAVAAAKTINAITPAVAGPTAAPACTLGAPLPSQPPDIPADGPPLPPRPTSPVPKSSAVAISTTWQSSHTGGSPPPKDGLLNRSPPGVSPRSHDEPAPVAVAASLPVVLPGRPTSPAPGRTFSPPLPQRPLSPPPARPPPLPAHIEADRSATATPSPPLGRPQHTVTAGTAVKPIPGQSATWMRRGSEGGMAGEGSGSVMVGTPSSLITGHHRHLATGGSPYSASPPPRPPLATPLKPVPVPATSQDELSLAASVTQPTASLAAAQPAPHASTYTPSVHAPPKVVPPLALAIPSPLSSLIQKSPRATLFTTAPQQTSINSMSTVAPPASASNAPRVSPRPLPASPQAKEPTPSALSSAISAGKEKETSGAVAAPLVLSPRLKPDRSPTLSRLPPAPVPAAPLPPQGTPHVSAPVCFECRSAFAGFRKRWACYNCGHSCCGPCSAFQAPLPHLGFTEPVRVCVGCAGKLASAMPLPPDVPNATESALTSGSTLKSILKPSLQ